MRKIVSLFAFVAIVITFAACGGKDGLNDACWANWEGEYEATEIIETILTNGEPSSNALTRTTTITIFRDTYLYVQTCDIGEPFIPGVDLENHTVIINAPKRILAGSIENVQVTQGPNVVIISGGVFSRFNGTTYAPKAIQAVAATETELYLLSSKPFEVTLFNEDMIDLGTVTCDWTYSPIRKEGDTYTWEAVLHLSPAPTQEGFNSFRHTLTMTKKPVQKVE